ncbi:MAG TPA: SDR family NAD(P)-dependent oxidoreductase [Ktedonobacteraceae bacterium]|jgi:NAD(P)-dependent dehydrogenase (short-subunit alcohol dehydrogenase family)|nr:SDR family NAD(P)-dependent oxidoreductase [Ktedonobacteraceae bacterium]
MSGPQKTAIVTGASQEIGAGIVKGFVERGFNVVANSRKVTQSTEVAASNHVALVDGHIGEPATAAKIVETALSRFQQGQRNAYLAARPRSRRLTALR